MSHRRVCPIPSSVRFLISIHRMLEVVYYFGSQSFLIDPDVSNITKTQAIWVGVGTLILGWVFYDALYSWSWAQANGNAAAWTEGEARAPATFRATASGSTSSAAAAARASAMPSPLKSVTSRAWCTARPMAVPYRPASPCRRGSKGSSAGSSAWPREVAATVLLRAPSRRMRSSVSFHSVSSGIGVVAGGGSWVYGCSVGLKRTAPSSTPSSSKRRRADDTLIAFFGGFLVVLWCSETMRWSRARVDAT